MSNIQKKYKNNFCFAIYKRRNSKQVDTSAFFNGQIDLLTYDYMDILVDDDEDSPYFKTKQVGISKEIEKFTGFE